MGGGVPTVLKHSEVPTFQPAMRFLYTQWNDSCALWAPAANPLTGIILCTREAVQRGLPHMSTTILQALKRACTRYQTGIGDYFDTATGQA